MTSLLWSGASIVVLAACAQMQKPQGGGKVRDAAANQGGGSNDAEPGEGVGGSSEVSGSDGIGDDDGSGGSEQPGTGAGGAKATGGGGGKADAGSGGTMGKGGSVGTEAGVPEASRGGNVGAGGATGGSGGRADAAVGRGGSDEDASVPGDAPCTPTRDETVGAGVSAQIKLETTGAVCIRITGAIQGWNANSMDGRTLSINGKAFSGTTFAGGSPGKWTDGKTYFDVSAGQYSYAGISIW